MNKTEELRIIQEKEIGILKEFIRICNKYNLTYFLVEGSMLGAVRHEGIIPWDDDIDVALYREDYEKFLQICSKELPYPYKCESFVLDSTRVQYLTQVVDQSTLVETRFKVNPIRTPIYIDVFVLDGISSNKVLGKIHYYHLLYRKLMLMWSDMDSFVVNRENRPLLEKLLIVTGRLFHVSRFISTRKQLMKMDRCMKRVPISEDRDVINFMSEYKGRSQYPYRCFEKGRIAKFGELEVRIPKQSETILEGIYGNYMELPPENARYKHSLKLIKY